MPDTTSHRTHGSHRLALFVDATNLSALVLGSGRLAARKVRRLRAAGLSVQVIAPTLGDELTAASSRGELQYLTEDYDAVDLGAIAMHRHRLLVIATGDRARDRRLAGAGLRAGMLVNVASQPQAGNFILPSIVDRSPLMVAISSGGASPVLARLLRARIEAFVPARYSELAQIVDRYRRTVAGQIGNWMGRRRFWEQILAGRAGELILQGRTADAEQAIATALANHQQGTSTGEVYLVGAGPGDPDLLSFRALRLMQQTDVVLYDRLVSDAVMALLPEGVERVYVGKRRSEHAVPQTGLTPQGQRLPQRPQPAGLRDTPAAPTGLPPGIPGATP